MYKIRSIQFINHPTLKNLKLDFCGSDRTAVDTVILAGENGTGKSTILNYLYGLFSGKVLSESELVLENNGVPISLSFKYDNDNKRIWVSDGNGMRTLPGLDDFKEKYPLSGIYSDVDINFHAQNVSSVTSLNLDESKDSRKSSTDLPRQIKQLIIDVQALDDAELAHEARKNPQKAKSELHVVERMPRFTRSFARMFDGLTYDRIENKNGYKEIFFKKYGISIPIDSLSSGEKQIVYAVIMSISAFCNSKNIKKGIENALVLDEIDLSPFYSTKTVTGDYGEERSIQTFEKMKLCKFICEKDDIVLKKVFSHLKDVIGELDIVYKETL